MKEGRFYYISVYQKAEKLGDCASVAVEMPSGHFEGPLKQKHLSWKLPGWLRRAEMLCKTYSVYANSRALSRLEFGSSIHSNSFYFVCNIHVSSLSFVKMAELDQVPHRSRQVCLTS